MSELKNTQSPILREGGTSTNHRNSNLELFRIVTMLLIVAHHYVVNSGLTLADGPIYSNIWSWRSIFLLLFGAWGKTGINCFMFITGYFMCKSHITVKKYLRLILEIVFYNVVITLIFLLSGYEPFSVVSFVKNLLPIAGVTTGFTSCYLLFYLCIPFLNILVRNMTEKQHFSLIALVAFIYIVMGTMPGFAVTMNYVSWFCVLYFIASYIRLYPKKLFDNTKLWGMLSAVSVIVSAASVVSIAYLAKKLGLGGGNSFYFLADSNKILAVITALCAFMFFKNVKIRYSKFINTVAASTFGVLMIHANSDAMRRWLWQDVLKNDGMYFSNYLVIHAVVSVLAVFAVCVVIDILRIHLLEKPFFKIWYNNRERILFKFQKIENKIFNKLNIKA